MDSGSIVFRLLLGFSPRIRRTQNIEQRRADESPQLPSMNDNLKIIVYMARHDPAVVVGLALIGAASTLFFHVTLKLSRVGFRSYVVFKPPVVLATNWAIPSDYLKARRKYGWSPWPVYCLWPCLVVGLLCLVFGLFRL